MSFGRTWFASNNDADSHLPVGTLIMVAIEGDTVGRVGRIVRKFKGLDESATRFGIQLIGRDAVPVRLIPRQPEDQGNNTQLSSITGLFLCRTEHPEQQDLMLVSSSALALRDDSN